MVFFNPKSMMWGAMVWQISMQQTKQTTLTTFFIRFFCELIFVGVSTNLLGCEFLFSFLSSFNHSKNFENLIIPQTWNAPLSP
jgi:hypothetical protein